MTNRSLRLHLGHLSQHLWLRGQVTVAEQRHDPVAGEPDQDLVTVFEWREQVVSAPCVIYRRKQVQGGVPSAVGSQTASTRVFQSMTPTP